MSPQVSIPYRKMLIANGRQPRPKCIAPFEDERSVLDSAIHEKSLRHTRSSPLSTAIVPSSGDYLSPICRIHTIGGLHENTVHSRAPSPTLTAKIRPPR